MVRSVHGWSCWNRINLRTCCCRPYHTTDGREIDYSRISEFLFDRGVASASITRLMDEIGELTRIARWYGRAKAKHPSEHETVAYLVVPLLRALG